MRSTARILAVTAACLAGVLLAGSPAYSREMDAGVGGSLLASTETRPTNAPQDPSDTAAGAAWQVSFESLASKVAAKYPSDYAGAKINEDHATGVILFAGAVPAGASELVATVKGATASAGSVLTDASASKLVMDISAATGEILGGKSPFAVQYKLFSGELIVSFGDPTVPLDVTAEQFEAALRAVVKIPDGPKLIVQASSAPPLSFQISGGGKLYANGTFSCSSAFTVKKTTSTALGLLTAGHCSASNVGYNAPVTQAYFSVAPYSQYTGPTNPSGDFRWLWSSVVFDGYTDVGVSLRKFSTSSTAVWGSSLCKYGYTTGYGCGSVTDFKAVSVVLPAEDGGYLAPVGIETCVTMNSGSLPTDFGDSGGSWFYGNTAYGVHSAGDHVLSCFSPVNNALSRFGMALWVG